MARNCHKRRRFRIHISQVVTHTFPMRWNKNISIKKIILLTGITLAVYLVMRYILPVAFPFLAGALLAMILNPIVEKVVRKTGRGRGTVSMVLFSVVLAIAGVICFFAVRSACFQLASLVKNAGSFEESMREMWCDCCERLERSFGVQIKEAEQIFISMQGKIRSGLQTTTMPYLLKNSVAYAKIVFSLMGIGIVSFISGILILTDFPRIAEMFHNSAAGRLMIEMKRHAKEAGGTYLKAQLIILLVISLICVTGLFLTGNPYAVLAGMGIGLCDALPFIGTGTIFVPWMILDIVNGKYILAAVYGLLYIICSFVRQLLEPRLIGERLGFPPIAVLMSLYFGIHVYGGAGVLLGPVSAFLIYELYVSLV